MSKTYKQFMSEMVMAVPVVDIETTGTDVNIPEIKNELNRNLDLVLNQQFKTVEEAANKIRKILALYTLDLPQVDIDDAKSGTLYLDVGHHNIKYDEIDGNVKADIPYNLELKYQLIDGLYKCSAELK